MSDHVRMNIATVVTLCMALSAGAWALSGELHNYRLRNITDRLKSHEDTILAHEKEIVQFRTIQLNVLNELVEIKTDIRNILLK